MAGREKEEVVGVEDGEEADFEVMVERLLELLSAFPSGARAELIKKKYEAQFPPLPEHWLKTLKDVPEIDTTRLSSIVSLHARKTEERKEKREKPKQEGKKVRLAMDLVTEKTFSHSVQDSSEDNADDHMSIDKSFEEDLLFMPKDIHSLNPDRGKKHQVAITFSQSLKETCIRFRENEERFDKLVRSLNFVYEQNKTPRLKGEEIQEGGLYAVHHENSWNRVVALSTVKRDQTVLVRFLDFGDTLMVHLNNIRKLRAQFTNEPCFALQIQLRGFDHITEKEQWVRLSERLCVLAQLTSDPPAPLNAEFVSNQMQTDGNLLWDVDLYRAKETVSINNILRGEIQLPPVPPSTSPTPTSLPKPKTPPPTKPKLLPPPSKSRPPPPSLSLETLPALHFSSAPDSEEAYVRCAPDPSEFSVVLKKYVPLLTYIEQTLEQSLEGSTPLSKDGFQTGKLYAAWDEESRVWNRVSLCGFPPLLGGRIARVFLVDKGEFSLIKLSLLRILPKELFQAPDHMLAVKCSLSGVIPREGESRPWSDEGVKQFQNKVVNTFVRIKGVSVGRWEAGGAPVLPNLLLSHMLDATGLEITEWLLNNGYASRA